MTNPHHYRFHAPRNKQTVIDRDAWIAQALAATARLRAAQTAEARRKIKSKDD